MLQSNYNTQNSEFQAISAILSQITIKKGEQNKLKPYLLKALKKTSFTSASKEKNIDDCGTFLQISTDGKIKGANFCKNKLCPLCQWRLSRKTYGKMIKAQQLIEAEQPHLQYIFVTLTLRNMQSIKIGIQDILKGFNNLTHDRIFRDISKGFYRRIEVTYNNNKNTWHPHIHMIMAVNNEYFQGKYLRKAKWAMLWKRACRLDYIPIVDVRKVSDNKEKAVAEIAKYTMKPFDIERARAEPTKIYSELLEATHHRRLSSYGGVYKKAVKAVGLSENMSLTDNITPDEIGEFFIFKNGKYERYIDKSLMKRSC